MLPRALEHTWMPTEMSGEKCSSLQLRFMSLEHLCSSFLALERSNHGLMDHRRAQKSNLQSPLRQKHNMGGLEAIVVSKHFIPLYAWPRIKEYFVRHYPNIINLVIYTNLT